MDNLVAAKFEFKNKNQIDFESAAPFLSEESKNWLINALEIKYPEGNPRIGQLKILNTINLIIN